MGVDHWVLDWDHLMEGLSQQVGVAVWAGLVGQGAAFPFLFAPVVGYHQAALFVHLELKHSKDTQLKVLYEY